MSSSVLVTGGAGYIGSHAVLALVAAGYRVAVIDRLSTGQRESVPSGVPLIVGDIADTALVAATLREHDISAVLHFAGSIIVPESIAQPLDYYRNNAVNSHGLIETCLRGGVERFVFSSTATIYGLVEVVPITEMTPTAPINPYGTSKLMTEWMLRDAAAAHPQFRYGVLRYFNVAGADAEGRTGQSTPCATHLIKRACQTALGQHATLEVFGTDYPTPDGTCIRDYIHVSDLADLHVQALRQLESSGESFTLNCGYGRGLSVFDIIRAVEAVTGCALPVRHAPRRAGDPPMLVAGTDLLRRTFDWQPRHADLMTIVNSALAWEQHLMERRGHSG